MVDSPDGTYRERGQTSCSTAVAIIKTASLYSAYSACIYIHVLRIASITPTPPLPGKHVHNESHVYV